MWLVLGPRALPELIRELAVDSKHRKLVKRCPGRKQILIYGAGTRGTLFVEFLKNCAPEEFAGYKIAGFLDENPKLRNRSLQGYKIYGGLTHLEALAELYPIDGIMVAITDLSAEGMKRVIDTASSLDLKVYQWAADRSPREVTDHPPVGKETDPNQNAS
jgi:FlaA1/EpsC-like NDP-sugar epimerase